MRKLDLRRMFRAGILLFGLLVSSSFAPSIANAASTFDNLALPVNRIFAGHTTSCPTEQNFSTSWYDTVLDDSVEYIGARTVFREALADALSRGSGWAVSQTKDGNAGYTNVFVTAPGRTSVVSFTDSNGYQAVRMTNVVSVQFQMADLGNNTCVPYLQYNGTIATREIIFNQYSGAYTRQPFFINNPIIYPVGYSGQQIPSSPPPPLNYAALGDSFSSGEGNPPFEAGTENTCHRSSYAYPRLLAENYYLNLTDFSACTGATTADVANEGTEDQVSTLSQDTDIVTLTIGGNDVGFKDFATACTISLCDFSTQAYQNIHNSIENDLPYSLVGAYQAIDNATSSETKVYVLGYPHIAPPEMPTGAGSMCWPLNGGVNNSDHTQNNGAAVYAIQVQLNDAIQDAVADYGSSKFQYIDPNSAGSPFIGHDWCSQDRYFQVVAWNALAYSYHPNSLGHSAYASVLLNALP